MKQLLASMTALALVATIGLAQQPTTTAPGGREAAAQSLPPAFGTIKSVRDNQLVLTDAFGKDWTFKCGESLKVQIPQAANDRGEGNKAENNYQAGKLADLKSGMLCNVAYQRDGDNMIASIVRAAHQQTGTARQSER